MVWSSSTTTCQMARRTPRASSEDVGWWSPGSRTLRGTSWPFFSNGSRSRVAAALTRRPGVRQVSQRRRRRASTGPMGPQQREPEAADRNRDEDGAEQDVDAALERREPDERRDVGGAPRRIEQDHTGDDVGAPQRKPDGHSEPEGADCPGLDGLARGRRATVAPSSERGDDQSRDAAEQRECNEPHRRGGEQDTQREPEHIEPERGQRPKQPDVLPDTPYHARSTTLMANHR